MLSLKLIRSLLGYVSFEFFSSSQKSGSPERFLNLVARSGINLWDMERHDGKFSACVAAGQYAFLRNSAKKAGVRLHVKKRHGFPFFFRKFGRRKGILVGIIIFLLIIYGMPMCIWSIDVQGNSKISSDKILQAASRFGLNQGTFRSQIDPIALQEKIMLEFPEISWMSVNTRGSTATIIIKEEKEKPQVVDSSKVCNIKAARSGQILKIDATVGQALVKAGDAVVEGQLLISGVIEDAFGGNLLKHASGTVIAETQRTLSVTIPMRQTVSVPTGKQVVRKSLNLFGFSFPLTVVGKPDGNYQCESLYDPIKAGETTMPISIYTEIWSEQQEEEIILTKEQAQTQAQEKLKELQQEWKDIEIVSESFEEIIEGEQYRVNAKYICEENIAVESEIITK